MDKLRTSSVARIFFVICLTILISITYVESQRSLLHWKRDLEIRLESYNNQRNTINEIIESSIYPAREPLAGPALIKGEKVRFSDLIIPNGALVLDSHVAQPTLKILVNKTRDYVNSKMNELYQVINQLDVIKQQIHDPNRQYIYKGSPKDLQQPVNMTVIRGTRIFKNLAYSHKIESPFVTLNRINDTEVNSVLRETYMENPQFAPFDSNGRLFFEGRKTFWNTVFARDLRSGCCDRLKPLHTSRMMLRSQNQDVLAPILLQSNPKYYTHPVMIYRLNTSQLHNRAIGLSPRFDDNGLILSQMENPIHLNNLINILTPINQPEILKKLIFRDVVQFDEVQLFNSPAEHRLQIGILSDGIKFDLSHENYLLKSFDARNSSAAIQQVQGTVVLRGDSHFLTNLEAMAVNRVLNFREYVNENIVRVDRPSIIRSPVQFVALPTILDPLDSGVRPPQRILMMRVNRELIVGSINGMRIPDDVVFLPPHPLARRHDEPIRVRGPKNFVNSLIMTDLVNVHHLVDGMQMPAGVIPLHLNDFMGSVGISNLVFVDGISANQITIQSGQFDELQLRADVFDDAQNLLVRSVFVQQPDGSQLIRGPLRVNNLRILGNGPGRGLLNGFRPNDVIELARQPVNEMNSAVIYGKKTFLAPVEVIDCIFNDINDLTNWTSHLIRVDKPDTVQTIHTKLAFVEPRVPATQPGPVGMFVSSSLQINELIVDFHEAKTQADYVWNWKFSPEFHILQQALMRGISNQTGGRYRVLNQVRVIQPNGVPGTVNGIALNDILTLNEPFRFAARFVLVGKVEVAGNLRADRITSAYPIDAMDLIQFHKYRVPLMGAPAPIQLNNLVIAGENKASFVQTPLLNNTPLSNFLNSIMSITRPQVVDTSLIFNEPVNLEGFVRTGSSLNGVKQFAQLAERLKTASYTFENGLQCNTVLIKT